VRRELVIALVFVIDGTSSRSGGHVSNNAVEWNCYAFLVHRADKLELHRANRDGQAGKLQKRDEA